MNLAIIKKWSKVLLGMDLLVRPQIDCPKLHYGRKDYDWTFCPVGINKDSIVYSFGIGHDISFDLALIENFGLRVFAFDPTPKSLAWLQTQRLPSRFQYFPWGLSDHDGTLGFYESGGAQAVSYTEYRPGNQINDSHPVILNVRRLSKICSSLNHNRIDILKLDIEGSEYKAIPDILSSNIDVKQILVEFHHRFGSIKLAETRRAIETLNHHGYRVFDAPTNGYEYSFLKTI